MSVEVLYNHWRTAAERLKGKGGITFAVVDSSRLTSHFDVGVAFCNPQDNFSRRTGRIKSLARTRSKLNGISSFTLPATEGMNLHTIEGRKAIISAVRSRMLANESQY